MNSDGYINASRFGLLTYPTHSLEQAEKLYSLMPSNRMGFLYDLIRFQKEHGEFTFALNLI